MRTFREVKSTRIHIDLPCKNCTTFVLAFLNLYFLGLIPPGRYEASLICYIASNSVETIHTSLSLAVLSLKFFVKSVPNYLDMFGHHLFHRFSISCYFMPLHGLLRIDQEVMVVPERLSLQIMWESKDTSSEAWHDIFKLFIIFPWANELRVSCTIGIS